MKCKQFFNFTANNAICNGIKKSIVLISLLFVCIPLSAAEITFSPGMGLSVYTIQSPVEIENTGDPANPVFSQKAVLYTLPVPSINLSIHFTHENSGFTFSIINNVGAPITLFKRGGFGNDQLRVITGSIFDGQLLFGYTYGVQQPFSIHCGVGPGVALGRFWTLKNKQKLENSYYAWTPIAVHLGFQYIFTQHVGITIDLHDMFSLSSTFSSTMGSMLGKKSIKADGFGNVFTFRLAVSFRL